MIEPAICVYCRNKTADVCVDCSRGESFYHLEPDFLDAGEHPPQMPDMGTLLNMPSATRLAFVVLLLHYLREGK